MKKIATILALALATMPLGAQEFDRARAIAVTDLKDALAELVDLRKTIEVERIPLAKELSDLEGNARRLREEAESSKRLVDNTDVDLNTREDRVKRLEANNGYLASNLSDYIRRFESIIHIGEQQLYQEKIDAAKLAAEDTTIRGEEKFRAQLAGIDAAFERMERVIGGDTFVGHAVMPGGSYEEGKFAILGPIAFFSSNNGVSGLAELEMNSTNAVVRDIGEDYYAGISGVAGNLNGIVPIDSTLGDARKMELTKETLIQHIQKGGIVMYPILGLAAFALIVAIFKYFEIGAVKRAKQKDLDIILDFLKNDDRERAMSFAKSVKGPVGEMLVSAVEHVDSDNELLEEVLYERIITTQPKLERMLPLIAVTAATSPLLGLLGTVTGMIKTFKLITVFGTGDARSLSSGISEALITTEFGLIIAIPALIVHALLSRKAKGVVGSMEQSAVGFINGLNEFRKVKG